MPTLSTSPSTTPTIAADDGWKRVVNKLPLDREAMKVDFLVCDSFDHDAYLASIRTTISIALKKGQADPDASATAIVDCINRLIIDREKSKSGMKVSF